MAWWLIGACCRRGGFRVVVVVVMVMLVYYSSGSSCLPEVFYRVVFDHRLDSLNIWGYQFFFMLWDGTFSDGYRAHFSQ